MCLVCAIPSYLIHITMYQNSLHKKKHTHTHTHWFSHGDIGCCFTLVLICLHVVASLPFDAIYKSNIFYLDEDDDDDDVFIAYVIC